MENMNDGRPAFSIIMPVFNTGIYLETAVESVLSQTFTDFELLLIDDGSTDGSSQKCDEYSKRDIRIKTIHQENRGICNARNTALKESKGMYVAFIDHDDEYSPNLLEIVYAKAISFNVDMVKFGKNEFSIVDGKIVSSWSTRLDNCIFKEDEIERTYFNLVNSRKLDCVWDCIYRRDFLVDNNLLFDENFTCGGEDIEFNTRAVLSSKVFCTISSILYNHYLRIGFSTSSKFNEKKIFMCSYQFEKFNINLQDHKIDVEKYKIPYIHFGMFYCFNMMASVLSSPSCKSSNKDKIALLDELRHLEFVPKWFFDCSFGTIKILPQKMLLSYYLYKYRMYRSLLFINNIGRSTKQIRKKIHIS